MQSEKHRAKLRILEQPKGESVPASPPVSAEDLATMGDLAIRSFDPNVIEVDFTPKPEPPNIVA